MNYKLLTIAALVASLGLLSFLPQESLRDTLKESSGEALLDVIASIEHLRDASKEHASEDALKSFHKARAHYKKFEFIYEYFHHSAIKKYVNGAPLPQLQENLAEISVIKPQGFQRIEEELYAESPDWNALSQLTKELQSHLEKVQLYHRTIRIYDRQILESITYELIRIYTLGVTGFENPDSDSSLRESQIALKSLESPLLYFATLNSRDIEVRKYFSHGKTMLDNADFDSFNRLSFLTEVIDPLFRITHEIHESLGIETLEETNNNAIPTNYRGVTSIFDVNLLNRDYFTRFPADETTEKRTELGRLLFYDPVLSFNNTLSCSSCHKPELAFTDGKPKSISNDGISTLDRNAPTLMNALFAESYFHDMRADRIERQTEHVMVSPKEFNIRTLDLAEKLKGSDEYLKLFSEAYPGQPDPLKPHNVQNALAVYVASLVSWNSPFDQYVRGKSGELDASVKRGFNLFMGKAACGTCHFAPTFAGLVPPFFDDSESEVIGIPTSNDTLHPVLDQDPGRMENGRKAERVDFYYRSFKTPTVRNAELTAPYFHNGSYPTLEKVMWFYNKGGGQGLGLDVPNQTIPFNELKLTKQEITDVVAFMKSLTDVNEFQDRPSKLPEFKDKNARKIVVN